MKVLILAVLFIGSSHGLGSGPYLPSGWKPSGPAFYLPTETEKPVPLKDVPVQLETETSGSSFLKEYGPPKVEVTEVVVKDDTASTDTAVNTQEVSQDLTVQALPDPITEQAFVVIEAKFNDEDKSAGVSQEVSAAVEESVETATATESNVEEETSTQSAAIIEGKSLEIETQTESSLAVEEEATNKLAEIVEEKKEEVKQESVDANVVAAIEKAEEVEIKVVEEGVKNIADALVNLENEIKAQQVQSIQEVTELRTIQETSGSAQQAPEGFLEYGPPGFTEYGPPKGSLTTADVEEKSTEENFDSNETRRRRFSPKFKKVQRKH